MGVSEKMTYEIIQIRLDKVNSHLRNMRMDEFKYSTWAWDYWCGVRNALERKKKEMLH